MKDAKAIRKHTAQHDLFNRIHSIAADEAFVHTVGKEWYNDRFDIVRRLIVFDMTAGTDHSEPAMRDMVLRPFGMVNTMQV